MRDVAFVGQGMSKFGDREDASGRELAFEAFEETMKDVDATRDDIDSMVTAFGVDETNHSAQPSSEVVTYLGLNPKADFRTEAACASGSAAVRSGYMTIASGLADVVLVMGVEKLNEFPTSHTTEVFGKAGDTIWEYPYGTTFPGYYAMMATAHMSKYGTTREQLSEVAVKNHKYATMNKYAHMQKEITLKDAVSANPVAHPLNLYDCSLITDGAASVLLASEEKAKEMTDTPVWITGLGGGTSSSTQFKRSDNTSIRGARVAAEKAYEMSSKSPEDIDVATVHDCFTIAEIIAYEDLGFCEKGKGGELVEEGETYADGKFPVNLDGGLKAKGHPIGATGVSMSVEIAKQLGGEAGDRQADGAEIGLTHNVGGNGQHVFVHIYERG
ncbi:hypothetical protein AKJ66_00180 [candidate division MSBL1 archaeon SCGC-AAA259E22]|uniref:Acetyl-CoA acetyltransferase n=1 Tax=candidate division MSBL1 archaeon SCGC-AAA259E22 TaxID=1698265 RepID=A0A133UIW1_9EURY|nr:hypothetical protein AKJ66_00180 [candidate division MSBL1 archaeon SCGC-AAA259E22]